jgi:hypothetical protein
MAEVEEGELELYPPSVNFSRGEIEKVVVVEEEEEMVGAVLVGIGGAMLLPSLPPPLPTPRGFTYED